MSKLPPPLPWWTYVLRYLPTPKIVAAALTVVMLYGILALGDALDVAEIDPDTLRGILFGGGAAVAGGYQWKGR